MRYTLPSQKETPVSVSESVSEFLKLRLSVWLKAGTWTVSCLPQLATHSRSWTKSLHHVGVYRLTAQLREWHGHGELDSLSREYRVYSIGKAANRREEKRREGMRRRTQLTEWEILRQKSIHQWQICWWYESIITRVKDRLSLIISLKIAQMTSVRHGSMWICMSDCEYECECGWGGVLDHCGCVATA